MTIVRDFISVVLAVLACSAIAVSVPGAWLRDHVVNEVGFMAIASPLAHNENLQQQLAIQALEGVAPNLPVPDVIRTQAEELLTSQVHVVTDTEVYQEIWDGTMRDMHPQLLAAGTVTIHADINPVWEALVKPIQDLMPFVDIPLPRSTVITLGTFDASGFHYLLWAAEHAQLLVVLGIACAVASLLLAHRRFFVALVLGLGLLIAAFGWWYVLLNHAELLPALIAQDPLLWPIVHEFLTKAYSDIKPIALSVGALGIVLLLLSIVGSSVMASRRRSQAQLAAAHGQRPLGDRAIRYDAYDS